MAKFQEQEYIFQYGDHLSHAFRLKKGRAEIVVPVTYSDTTYPIRCAEIHENSAYGLEFLFHENTANYGVVTITPTDVETISGNILELYQKPIEEIRALTDSYSETVKSVLKFSDMIEKTFSAIHKIYHSHFLALGYLHSKYSFSLPSDNLKPLMNNLLDYAKQKNLESSIFPISNALYSISFTEFDELATHLSGLDLLYLSRALQVLPQLRKAFATEKVFTVNFLVELVTKTRSIIERIQKRVQTILNYFVSLGSESTGDTIRSFLEQAAKSPEISSYIISISDNAINFTVQKVIQELSFCNSELFSLIQDQVETLKTKLFQISQTRGGSLAKQGNIREALPEELKGSLGKILNFSELETEFSSKFLEEFNRWKLSPDRLSVDDEASKMRKRITEYFWQIYLACFKRHRLDGKPLVKPVELMFKYGFMDETLISGSLLKGLVEKSSMNFQEQNLKIYNVYDWLITVCDEVYPPSNSKTGEYIEVVLREMARDEEQSTGKKADPQSFNTLEFRIDYEIDNFVKEASKMCSGAFQTYIPVLLEEQIPMLDFKKQYMDADKIAKAFFELKKVDFSAFYREVRYKTDNIEEFIQKEVLPMIILMPGVGSRTMVWQPKERLKETSARIAFPFLSLTSLINNMIYTFGFFRWELVKDILGPSWNDISLLSLTSDYSDYESSYKNSKEIDDEVKEKVAQDFKKYRSTRERFIHDYIQWVTKDSQGRPGVNKVVRELFYRHIPFPKAVRTKLAATPTYEQFDSRYMILLRKELARLKVKYQKYQNSSGALPEELEAYLQFLIR